MRGIFYTTRENIVMKTGFRTKTALLVTAIALTTALPAAHAGKATIASGEGNTMEFEYSGDSLLRLNTQDQDGYMVVRDNTLYVVSYSNGQPMVMNASSMMKGFSAMTPQTIPSASRGEFVSLKGTGQKEKVAGINGEVYELTYLEDGVEKTMEMVLSRDKRAREFRDAMFIMARASGSAIDDKSLKEGEELKARMTAMNMGVLRVGQDMTVTRISGDKVAAARFELPAEPMDMQGLGDMMNAAMGGGASAAPQSESEDKAESGGLFSTMMGALGGKAERQSDRAAGAVDNEVDEQTDEAVDKSLGKAFKKLFGN